MSRFKKDYVAVDGTVYKTEEEMLEIDERVEKLFLIDKIHRVFQFLHSIETIEWLKANISHRNEPHRTIDFILSCHEKFME